jgi:hypothetical protein
MNSPVAFDKSLTYNVDGIYFGSTAKAASGHPAWKAKSIKSTPIRSGVTSGDAEFGVPSTTPTAWTISSMFDSPAPISASVSLSTDLQADNVWAFFGTGRYQSTADKADQSPSNIFSVSRIPTSTTAHVDFALLRFTTT